MNMHTRQSHEFKEGSFFPCTTLSFVFREFIHAPVQNGNWESIGALIVLSDESGRRLRICVRWPVSCLRLGYTRDRE